MIIPHCLKKYLRFTSLCSLILLPCLTNAETIYSIGVVPQFEARRIAEIWQPILAEISQLSGVKLELKASPNIPAFEQQFTAGEFDFAYMNPYHAIIANKKPGYTPLLRDNGRSLFGIIVVKKDSPIQSVSELDGKTVAFPAPNALGAALLPRAEFDRKFKIKINELYVKSHSSVYLNVLLGKAEAGGGVQKTLSQQPAEVRDQLRVLYQTTKVAPHPLTAHPRIDAAIQDRVKTAFLQLGDSEKGQAMLKTIPMKQIGPASIDDYAPLKEMGLDQYYVVK
jgi:phosphonate transport system substrate-binding protein